MKDPVIQPESPAPEPTPLQRFETQLLVGGYQRRGEHWLSPTGLLCDIYQTEDGHYFAGAPAVGDRVGVALAQSNERPKAMPRPHADDDDGFGS